MFALFSIWTALRQFWADEENQVPRTREELAPVLYQTLVNKSNLSLSHESVKGFRFVRVRPPDPESEFAVERDGTPFIIEVNTAAKVCKLTVKFTPGGWSKSSETDKWFPDEIFAVDRDA